MKNLQPWLKNGIIYGILSIIFLLITIHLYYFNLWFQTVFTYGLLLILFYATVKTYKSENEGFLPYGETFKYNFLMGVVGFAILSIFSIIYYNFINPEAAVIFSQNIIASTEATYRSIGIMSENQIMKAMEMVEESQAESLSVSGLALGFISSVVIVLIFSAIASIFLKKEKKQIK